MGRTSKALALITILIVLVSGLSLFMVKPANAQVITPSVPEFTVNYLETSINVTIKNQALIETTDSNASLYYGLRFKDHNDVIGNWNYAPIYYVGISSYGTYYEASSSDYTEVYFPLESYPLTGILDSGRIDLQVMALIGNEVPTNYENGSVYGFNGAEGNWSTTQTITIPHNSASPTPTVPEFPSTLLIISFLVAATLLGTIVIRNRKNKRLVQ